MDPRETPSEKNKEYISSIDTFYNLIKEYASNHGINTKNEKHLLAAFRVLYTGLSKNNKFLINSTSKTGVSCEVPSDKDVDMEGFIDFNDVMNVYKKRINRNEKLMERIAKAKTNKTKVLTKISSN